MRGQQNGPFFCAIGMAMLLAGCATTQIHGRRIPPDRIAQIAIGTTTEEELRSWLGKPTATQQRSSGRRVLIYEFAEHIFHRDPWVGRLDTRFHRSALYVLIEEGKVLDYTLSEQHDQSDEVDRTTPRYIPIIIPI